MKLIFFGSGTFGLKSLEAIRKSAHQLLGVVTTPDKPQGRGQKIQSSPIKIWAEQNGVAVFPLENVNRPESLDFLSSQSADLFLVISFGTILKEPFLNMPPKGCVNVHPSLLPKYRGASPVVEAIRRGDDQIGTTIMRIAQAVDSGDILLQEAVDVSGDMNILEANAILESMSARLLVQALDLIEKDAIKPKPQDSRKAVHCSKFKKEDGNIDWRREAPDIHNQVRAFLIWPGSSTSWRGKKLSVLKTQLDMSGNKGDRECGAVIEADPDQGLKVACGKGALWIKELQIEGKKAMRVKDFLNGNSIKKGNILGR